MPAFACWVKKVSVGGGAIFIRKICAECTFHKASNGPLQGGAWQGPCGQSGYFEWGEGCVCHFPGMLPCWSGQCSGQLVSQCYKPGDTAGHLHLRMAKKSKKGNPTPFTHGKEVQKRKFDSTKTMADKFKSWKYNSTMTYAICVYYIFRHLVSCKGNTNIHRLLWLFTCIFYNIWLVCLLSKFLPAHIGLGLHMQA